MGLDEGDERCEPVTGNVDNVDEDSMLIEGINDVVDEVISCALVPDPKRYTFPRHVTVDGPVNALK